MRVTDPQIIQNGEKDLIASVQRDLDLDAVRDLLKERLTVTALSPKGGRIVVHDNDVAFRLDYQINLNGSLLFDRNGNLIEDSDNSTVPGQEEVRDEDSVPQSDQDDNLSINLPEYDDAPDDEQSGDDQAQVPAPEDLSDESRQAEPGLEIEDLEDDAAFGQDDSDIIGADDMEELNAGELPDIDLEDGDKDSTVQDMVDDDISDILQESRDFWEKKKEE